MSSFTHLQQPPSPALRNSSGDGPRPGSMAATGLIGAQLGHAPAPAAAYQEPSPTALPHDPAPPRGDDSGESKTSAVYDALIKRGNQWQIASDIYDGLAIPAMNNQAAWLAQPSNANFNALFGVPGSTPLTVPVVPGLYTPARSDHKFVVKVSDGPAPFLCGISGGGANSTTPVWSPDQTPTDFTSTGFGGACTDPVAPPSFIPLSPVTMPLQVNAQNTIFNLQQWYTVNQSLINNITGGLLRPIKYGTLDRLPLQYAVPPKTGPPNFLGNYNAVFFSVRASGEACKPACDVYARLCWAPGVTKASITGFKMMDDVTVIVPRIGGAGVESIKYADRQKYKFEPPCARGGYGPGCEPDYYDLPGAPSPPTASPLPREQFTSEDYSMVNQPIDGFANLSNYNPSQYMTVTPGYWRSKGHYQIDF